MFTNLSDLSVWSRMLPIRLIKSNLNALGFVITRVLTRLYKSSNNDSNVGYSFTFYYRTKY